MTCMVLLSGRVITLYRVIAAHSHHTFSTTICWSVCMSVQCIVATRPIGCYYYYYYAVFNAPYICQSMTKSQDVHAVWDGRLDRSGDEAGGWFWDWSMQGGQFWGQYEVPHCKPMRNLQHSCGESAWIVGAAVWGVAWGRPRHWWRHGLFANYSAQFVIILVNNYACLPESG